MTKYKKFLFISIISIFNFVVVLILTFFYFNLQKKIKNIPKLINTSNDTNGNQVHEEYENEQEQIFKKIKQGFEETKDFFENFLEKDSQSIEKVNKILQKTEELEKTFKVQKQDQKTKDTFEKYKQIFQDSYENIKVDSNEKTNFQELVVYMNNYLNICKTRDKYVLDLEEENKTRFDEDFLKQREKNVKKLRNYLNGYAFLLDLHLDVVKQITYLINISSKTMEKNQLKELKTIISKEYTKCLLELIKSERANPIIKKLLHQ